MSDYGAHNANTFVAPFNILGANISCLLHARITIYYVIFVRHISMKSSLLGSFLTSSFLSLGYVPSSSMLFLVILSLRVHVPF